MPNSEKNYFTIYEIASRWQMSDERIIELIQSDKLRLCVNAINYEADVWDEFGRGDLKYISGTFYLDTWENINFTCDLEYSCFPFSENYLYENREMKGRKYIVTNPEFLSVNGYDIYYEFFFISREERDLFEKANGLIIDSNDSKFQELNKYYSTPLLRVLNAVVEEFWSPDSVQGHQKKEVVVRWILDNYGNHPGISENIAKAIDTITRHPDRKVRNKNI